MTPGQRLRQIANVVNLSTPLGLVIAVASKSPRRPGPRGLIIASDYAWKLPKAGAFTMGNVVLYRAGRDVAGRNEVLLGHEERHSTQYAYCLGLPFLVFYGRLPAGPYCVRATRAWPISSNARPDLRPAATSALLANTGMPEKESRQHETHHDGNGNGKCFGNSGHRDIDARSRDPP